MRIAIIDMGTNTFNLLIAETTNDNKYKIIYKDKAGVKLGKGGINNSLITPEAFERGINAIDQLLEKVKVRKAEKVHITATSGVRSAKNGADFVKQLENKFRIAIQVVSGDEEAELIYRGVKQVISFNQSNSLILDIGGGSNEFIIANKSGIVWKQSFDLGMARMLDRFNPSDPIKQDEIIRVEDFIDKKLVNLHKAAEKYKPDRLIGCSGTFNTFKSMIIAKKRDKTKKNKKSYSYPISLVDYQNLHAELLKSTLDERIKMKGIELVRVEMIVLASIFVNFILKKFNLKSITQSSFAIKEGIIDKTLNS